MKNIINITEIKERIEKLSLNEVIDEMSECEQIVDDSFQDEHNEDDLNEKATIILAETMISAFYLETRRRLLIANI